MAQSSQVIVHIDGASRGNPGPAAYGVVIKAADGSRLAALSHYLGEETNNVAEYQGLLAALDYALGKNLSRLRVRTDFELMALQIQGVYKVRSPWLRRLHNRAQELIARLESFSIEHIPREQNREADRLANHALDDAARGPERGGSRTAPTSPERKVGNPLRTSATFREGVLEPHFQLSLLEGEVVDLVIYRKE